MYRDTTNVEPEMYDYTSNNWSHWNGNEKLKEKFGSGTKKTFDRFTTKDSYTWNITHNTESTAVWSLEPERWGSLLVQENYQEEKACDKRHPYRKIMIIIIIIVCRNTKKWTQGQVGFTNSVRNSFCLSYIHCTFFTFDHLLFFGKMLVIRQKKIPVVVRSKKYVWNRLLAGIEGSNPAEGMDARLLCLLCVMQLVVSETGWSLLRRSPMGCVCPIVYDLESWTVRRPKPALG